MRRISGGVVGSRSASRRPTGVCRNAFAPVAQQAAVNPFGSMTPQAHPYLSAALNDAAPAAPASNLFERTLRSVLRGLPV
jgi:hypothetical protein